ncbi:MAG: type I secretion system permease/ATPase [Roseinatronobacter sp.]
MTGSDTTYGTPEMQQALRQSRGLLVGVVLFSALVNLLMLTGPLFMLQVYDRVLASGSEQTLAALFGLMTVLFLFMGVLDHIRARVLSRAGARFQTSLDARVFRAVLRRSLLPEERARHATAMRDLESVQRALSGQAPFGWLDLPWTPLFLAIIFLFHWALGLLALAGGLVLVIMALVNQRRSQGPMATAAEIGNVTDSFAETARRETETVHGLGMQDTILSRWQGMRNKALEAQIAASDVVGGYAVGSKTLRLFLQSAILGLGALLAIGGQITPGIMIAASILMGRALAPVDQVIGHWPTVSRAFKGWRNLSQMLERTPPLPKRTALPAPKAQLDVAGVVARAPGAEHPTISGIAFSLKPGQVLGITGPSAAGKSTLARVLTGIWRPLSGSVRLDGAAVDQYDPEILCRHIGYLPQEVVLFDGTVAQNIARFDPAASDADIVTAAQRAGAHQLILDLPRGYDTPVGPSGARLSGGQRQRIGLARAFYRDPVLLVLDEPNSHLDSAGDQALAEALSGQRARGGIAVVIAHRPAAIMACDLLMILAQGRIRSLGPRDMVLDSKTRATPQVSPVPKPVAAVAK